MNRYLCQMCNTIVKNGEGHPCFSHKTNDADIVYEISHSVEKPEMDVKHGETKGDQASNSTDVSGNVSGTAHEKGSASRDSPANFVFTTQNKEQDEGSLELTKESIDRPIIPEASFEAQKRKEKPDADVKPSPKSTDGVAVAGPSDNHPHSIEQEGKNWYACDLCPKKLQTKFKLTRHQLTHSGQNSFACDNCRKVLTQKGALKRHIKAHSGEKPFACDICGYAFNRKWNLERHSKITHKIEALCV